MFRWVCFALVVASFALGCDGGAGEASAVSGLVTLDGKPLAGAGVTFEPALKTSGRGAVGISGPDGKFIAKPPGRKDELAAGKYKVIVSRYVLPDGAVFEPNDTTSPLSVGASEQLPPRYSDPERTELTAELPAGGGTVNFELTSRKRK